MRIFVLRHEQRFQDPTFETSLTPIGLENARKLSSSLDKYNITKIYCSPFKRIIQTVEPYLIQKQLKVNIDYSLNESLFEGEAHASDIRNINESMYGYKYFNLDYVPVTKCVDLTFPETYTSIIKRTNRLLDWVKSNSNDHNNILFVTHMTCVNALLQRDAETHYEQGKIQLLYEAK